MSRTGICQGHPAGWVVNDDGGAGNHTLIPAIIATDPRQGRLGSANSLGARRPNP